MSDYLLIKLFHLLCFVYWLGGDLGTFYASGFVARKELGAEARRTAFKIMMGCDQAPRLSMPLVFGSGVHLSAQLFLVPGGTTAIVLGWLVALGWALMVLVIHFAGHRDSLRWLIQFDFAFRIVAIALIGGVGAISLFRGQPVPADWLAYKLLVFAALVFCGLMVRVMLKPFAPAWARLVDGNAADEDHRVIESSISRVRPFVIAIWVGLLVSAALGLHLV